MKILIILCIISIWMCNSPSNKVRPSNLSTNAIWKGGSDGGCWIEISPIDDNTLLGKVFHENGDIWEEGQFVKHGECSIKSNEIINSIIGFDGENLLTNLKCKYTLKLK